MAKKITAAESVAQLKKANHKKAYAESVEMVKKYQKHRTKLQNAKKKGEPVPADAPEWPVCFSFNKKGIQHLLKKPGCAGLRMYPALHPDGHLTLVLVAFDEEGNNLTPGAKSVPSKSALKTAAPGGSFPALKAASDEDTLDESQINPPFYSPPLP